MWLAGFIYGSHTITLRDTPKRDWTRGMSWSGMLGKTAVGLGALAVPVVFAVAGAGQASAGPGACVSGPFGYAQACLDLPWIGWGVPHWDGGWGNGWHGDDDWEWDD